ncbi:MAG: hypothetical protein HEQ21_08345 [Blastomonas sp.]|uniref:reverse transcriptase domain-containing protein n=1 Tax=Blastomonas sp. TaxID=1909299 RepID=UPI002584DDCE|nr:reverse transcriptase domain-containing protein [Blastomonas sp.]MCO5792815.1 hypothetical protein [Blastomonas sp.]
MNYFHLLQGGHVAAVRQHKDAKWVASLDLQRFFDQISRTKIHRSLKVIGIRHAEAWGMACDSTVDKQPPKRRFSLPFGFVQSPILASVVLAQSALGGAIRQIMAGGVTVTVYVDDITVSGVTKEEVAEAIVQLEAGAQNAGFTFNQAKTQPPDGRVNSFNIGFGSGAMEVLESRMAEFQIAIHNGNEFQIEGIIGYVDSVNHAQADELADEIP